MNLLKDIHVSEFQANGILTELHYLFVHSTNSSLQMQIPDSV